MQYNAIKIPRSAVVTHDNIVVVAGCTRSTSQQNKVGIAKYSKVLESMVIISSREKGISTTMQIIQRIVDYHTIQREVFLLTAKLCNVIHDPEKIVE